MEKKYIWQKNQWPSFQWNNEEIIHWLTDLRKTQGKLHQQSKTLQLKDWAEILIHEATNTSLIEGEVLEPRSLRSSVARRLGIPDAGSSVEKKNVQGLVDMLLDASQNYREPLTMERLCGWQAALFPSGYSGIHPVQVGKYRTGSDPMRVISGALGKEKVHFMAPPSEQVPAEMKTFLKWFHKDSLKLDGLIRAAIAHLWFVTIHPFDDGNGRIARAISDLALAQDENQSMRLYSVSEQLMMDRKNYYAYLEKTQKGDLDITLWLVWFLQVLKKSIHRSMQVFEKTSLMEEFWKKAINLDLNSRQKKVLQKMLEYEPQGFEGGMTNKKYTHIAKVSRETAKRDLADLCEKKLLTQKGQGRSVHYILKY